MLPPDETAALHRVLVVDDDEPIRELTTLRLIRKGFEVVAASSVNEALRLIATETFDVLITDLNMPNAGDGYTVVTAMRHSSPHALILLVSSYPDVQRAMATIALQVDKIIVKPFDPENLTELVREKVMSRKPASRTDKQRVSAILRHSLPDILKNWLARAQLTPELNHLNLTNDERTGHLSKLVEDLVSRLDQGDTTLLHDGARPSRSAVEHGQLRCRQGYTSAMLVHESRILQVTLFETLQSNFGHLDFSLLLPDVMKIADEVDAQLTQSMESFTQSKSRQAA